MTAAIAKLPAWYPKPGTVLYGEEAQNFLRKQKRAKAAIKGWACKRARAAIRLARQDRAAAAQAIELIDIALNWEDSETRLLTMYRLLALAPDYVVWPVFLKNWSDCDATWGLSNIILWVLKRNTLNNSHQEFFSKAQRRAFELLPPGVRIYRGCSRDRALGMSWSLKQGVAANFARGHRGIPVPDPVIVSATVPKEEVLAIFLDRKEREILVDPATLEVIEVSSFEKAEEAAGCTN